MANFQLAAKTDKREQRKKKLSVKEEVLKSLLLHHRLMFTKSG